MIRSIEGESTVTFVDEEGTKVTKELKELWDHPEDASPPTAGEFDEALMTKKFEKETGGD